MIYGDAVVAMPNGRTVVAQFGAAVFADSKMHLFMLDPLNNGVNRLNRKVLAEFFYVLRMHSRLKSQTNEAVFGVGCIFRGR